MGQYDLFRKIAQSNLTSKERDVNLIIYDLLNDFEDSLSFNTVLINSISYGVHITNDSTSINQMNQNSKNIVMKPNDPLRVGDVIDYDNQKWLCLACEKSNDIYYKGKIQKAEHTLNYHESGILFTIPAVVESSIQLYRMGSSDGKYISLPEGIVVIRVPNNNITSRIKRSEIYKLAENENYKVNDTNSIIESGIIVLKMEWSSEEQIIPDIEPIPLGLSAKIINPQTSIIKGSSADYTGQFYEDRVEIDTELATFFLTDVNGQATSLATITGQDSSGSCTVLAGDSVGYVKLWLRNTDGSIVCEPVTIQIRNIF